MMIIHYIIHYHFCYHNSLSIIIIYHFSAHSRPDELLPWLALHTLALFLQVMITW